MLSIMAATEPYEPNEGNQSSAHVGRICAYLPFGPSDVNGSQLV